MDLLLLEVMTKKLEYLILLKLARISYSDDSGYIWNQTTGECLATVNAHDSAIKSCAWIAKAAVPKKGKMTYKIVTAGLDREVKTWRISESGHRLKHVYKGHVGTVNSVQVSPTGKKVHLIFIFVFIYLYCCRSAVALLIIPSNFGMSNLPMTTTQKNT